MISLPVFSSQLIYKLTVIILVIVSALTLASFFGQRVYLELTTHFRLQYAIAATICIVPLVALHSWRLLPLAIGCALLNWIFIVPYYFGKTPSPDWSSATHLRLMQANVMGNNRNYGALIKAVQETGADIVVLQEITEEWDKHLGVLYSDYQYHKTVPRPGGSGMSLLSRYPIEELQTLTLDASTHPVLWARINVAGTKVSLLLLHPPTPVRTDKFLNRNEQFTRAAALIRTVDGARILMGDLNTTMWSPYFAKLVRESGLRDARRGYGLCPSWPLPLPAFLQIPIDHCLVSEEVAVEGIATGPRTGSDHRTLIVNLMIRKQEAPGL